jgi:hypothetical protein
MSKSETVEKTEGGVKERKEDTYNNEIHHICVGTNHKGTH